MIFIDFKKLSSHVYNQLQHWELRGKLIFKILQLEITS